MENERGLIAWAARNPVFANLLMLFFLLGGLFMLSKTKEEVFPEVEIDKVFVAVAYPGASPAEVESGVLLAIEEAVRGVDGVDRVIATATEGSASVEIELLLGADRDQVFRDVEANVGRITSFPVEIERPTVSLLTTRRRVITLVVHGEVSERALKQVADGVRDELLARPDITYAELSGIRPPEISVELSEASSRRWGVTLDQVAEAVRRASVESPGGALRTPGGEVLVRVDERRERGEEFEDIAVLRGPAGGLVTLGEIATIRDEFAELDQATFFENERAAQIEVFRVGDEGPIEIARAVREYAEQAREQMPPGIGLAVVNDRSEIYADRISLLLRNAAQGLVLVLIVLGLFLELRLAFWVTLGIPISFLGAFFAMPTLDVSLNMISLFAFILTLGIVVDDAIVVGEAVYKHRRDGKGAMGAAIAGAREVAGPVVFSVLTTVIAFAPLLFLPGTRGKFFRAMPMVVIPILLISLVESLLILPAHLGHSRATSPGRGLLAAIGRGQERIAAGLESLIARFYEPLVRRAVRRRYVTIAAAIAALIISAGLIAGGRVKFVFFPKIEGDTVSADIEMPFGTAAAETERALDRVLEGAERALTEIGGEGAADRYTRGSLAKLGSLMGGGGGGSGAPSSGGHVAGVTMYFVPADERPFTMREFTQVWREKVGPIPGAEAISFDFNIGPGAARPIQIELSHARVEVLEEAARRLAERLAEYDGVSGVADGFASGKPQIDFRLTAAGRAAGLTQFDLARQLRSAFFGAEAARQQRGRDEVRVYVRRPESERRSEYALESLMLRTPSGAEIPLSIAAEKRRGRAYTQIERQDGRRLVRVSAELDTSVATPDEVLASLTKEVMPSLVAGTPGLSWEFGGDKRDQNESFGALRSGFALALLAMFGLMALAFRSYAQPAIVMCAIPFGIVGAVIGHVIMGYDLSFVSAMGIIALSGVVVNDSLVLVDAINTYRAEGMDLLEAIVAGGARRFRPILLTTLTTFFGLVPMILETSVQARFLIPVAISLGFGILFVTFIALLLVPSLYAVVEDAKRAVAWMREVA